MNWLTQLRAKLYPSNRLGELSTFDQARFTILINFGWFGMLVLSIITLPNVYYQKYDRAFDNLITISAYLVPTLWLTYRHKLKLASWYLIIAMYIAAVWGIYARLMAHADVHLELNFILIGLFSVILLEGKTSLITSIFLAISYLVARTIVLRYLRLPFEIGQLISGGGVFVVLIYISHIVKKTAITIQAVIQKQNSQLQKVNYELSELNRVKDKLFAILGHDLRSPIASLKIQLQNVQEGYSSNKQNKDANRQLQQTVDGVFTMLDNLLNWAQLQRGGIRIHATHFDLSDIAQSIVELYSAELLGKQLTISAHNEIAPVTADEYLLTIVARNLLQNAIKFTPVGGHIQLSTRRLNGKSQFIIQDSGIGMDRLTQTYMKGIGSSRYGTEGEKGTGLGLEISREFVRLNKGNLLIDSILGRGTTVTIEF